MLPLREASAMSGTRRKAGRLGSEVEGYRDWLAGRGYAPSTVRNMLKDLGQVGRWLSAEGLEVEQLDEDVAAAFIDYRLHTGRRRVIGLRGMRPLLGYLREVGAIPAAAVSLTPVGVLLEQYRLWLVRERGLAAQTVLRYEC